MHPGLYPRLILLVFLLVHMMTIAASTTAYESFHFSIGVTFPAFFLGLARRSEYPPIRLILERKDRGNSHPRWTDGQPGESRGEEIRE